MRIFTNVDNNENILLHRQGIMYKADIERIMGLKNVTIYLHYNALMHASSDFLKMCTVRNIRLIVVY